MSQDRFLSVLLAKEVLIFGEFITKSKRTTPYFFNTGRINSGESMTTVAEIYAKKIYDLFGNDVTTLYGPAYKGIPLCVMTAQKLAALCGRDIYYTFNRKEVKDHGEGGSFVGYQPKTGDKVVIVEDVLTAGTSLKETFEFLKACNVKPVGSVIGIDRQEKIKPEDQHSAKQTLSKQFDIDIETIITLKEIVERLYNKPFNGKIWIDDQLKDRIDRYLETYCVLTS